MAFSMTVTCPGCGENFPVDGFQDWVRFVNGERYHSPACAAENGAFKAFHDLPVDHALDCPVCAQRGVTDEIGNRVCAQRHVWKAINGVPMYLWTLDARPNDSEVGSNE